MGDIFGYFFSTILVVLFVLRVLRRFSGPLKKAEKDSAKKPAQNRAAASSVKPAASLVEQFRALEERLSAGTSDGKTPAAPPDPEKVITVRQEPWPGSPAAPAEPVPAAAPPVSVAPKKPVLSVNTQATAGKSVSGSQPMTAVPGALERLDRLPPLARGLFWSFILEPPPSFNEPRY